MIFNGVIDAYMRKKINRRKNYKFKFNLSKIKLTMCINLFPNSASKFTISTPKSI